MNTPVGPDKRLNYYRMTPDAVIDELHTHKHGLTTPESKRRLEQHGLNTLEKHRGDSVTTLLFRQFKSLFVAILFVGAVFSLYLGDTKTAVILLLIALMNTVIGFIQEHKAESLLADLEQLIVPKAKVVRSAQLQIVPSSELVLGDIIRLEAGDSVPADLRILEEDELSTNDFALTGESNPTRKFVHAIATDVPLASRQNLVFMGTTVATGSATGVVVGVGMHTELGRIASLAETTQSEDSPLQKEMNNLAVRLTQATLVLAAILAVVALQADLELKAALLFAISIAAAMIPNGLVAEVNITLAQTAARMTKAKALVKKLSAVETLGATNLILTDKTGTLTKNEMTVVSMRVGKFVYSVTGTGYEPAGGFIDRYGKPVTKKTQKDLELFFRTAVMASNAEVKAPDADHPTWYVVGDPTEGALITLACKADKNPDDLNVKHKEIKEFQFDSGRKLMSSVRRYRGKTYVYAKGAPEAILARSTHIWDHGHVRALTAEDKKLFREYNESQAQTAMRNLAFAYAELPGNPKVKDLKMEEVESKLTLLGMVSMVDPLREQAPAAMVTARSAHVKVSIITGDYAITARAIAEKANLAPSTDHLTIVEGHTLESLADNQILQYIERGGTVFSRVSPEDKLRIVEIAKRSGRVVGVTGDGINDAPALKRADIGVAMGLTGTDVAKDAADIVLLDDSFNTLVGAVEQGRLTFQNIKKAARCALTDNAGELFIILISLVMGTLYDIPLAITAILILAVDVIAEMFPISALGWDKAQRNLMTDKPRKLTDHIFNKHSVKEFLGYGFLSAVIAYANFLFFFERQGLSPRFIDSTSHIYMQATILTYVTVVLCQFANLLLVRTDEREPFFSRYLWSNKKLLIAFGVSFFCIFNMIYNPLVQPLFNAQPLSATDWLTAVMAAAVYLIIRLIIRDGQRQRHHVVQLHHEVHGHGSPFKV